MSYCEKCAKLEKELEDLKAKPTSVKYVKELEGK